MKQFNWKMGPVVLLFVVFAFVMPLFAEAAITLDPISVLYVPFNYNQTTGKGMYGIAKGASEQSSYDSNQHMLYIAGDNFVQVVDVSNPESPTIIHRLAIDRIANDIEVCGDLVAFVQDGPDYHNAPGRLQVYRLYNETNQDMDIVYSIPVGSVPDMLQFTSDCQTVVIANEGEYGTRPGGGYVDPEGIVSIVRLNVNNSEGFTVNNLNFTSFNERTDEYVARGVRYPFRNGTFSMDLEPEYLTINADETLAFVSLQENNAIAVISLLNDSIIDIYPLGEKSWKGLRLDASNADGGIMFGDYDIYTFYQPDAVKYFEVGGTGYILTANEGASLEYYPTWTEEKRGKSLVTDNLVWDGLPSELLMALNDTAKLGRLKFSQYDGRNQNKSNKIDKLYTFGGRSISVRRASDMALIHDTGDEIEYQSSILLTNVFNADTRPIDRTPEQVRDARSDDKGAECESLALGEIDGIRVLFVGIERLSAIAIYTFPPGSAIPNFDGFYRAGWTNRTYEQLFEERNVGDLDPEDMKFLPSDKSPTGRPMLVVTNNISGSISFYHIINTDSPGMTTPTSSTSKICAVLPTAAAAFIAMATSLLSWQLAGIYDV